VTTERITIVHRDGRAPAELAAHIAAAGRAAWAARGRFTVAVSAALLDQALVDALAAPPLRDERFWRGTRLFLADTWLPGCELPSAALRAAVLRLPLAPGAAHVEAAGGASAVAAAGSYEQELRAIFSLAAGELPRFDLCVLATDEAVASGGVPLGGRAVDEIARLVVAEFIPGARRSVVTLTPPVIQNAAAVVVVRPTRPADAPAAIHPAPDRPCAAGAPPT
jgi:6-phosphogluconolactonase